MLCNRAFLLPLRLLSILLLPLTLLPLALALLSILLGTGVYVLLRNVTLQ